MSKTAIKHEAQDQLMMALQTAFTAASETGKSEEVLNEMRAQFTRIEKLLGYTPNSWKRGC